MRSKKVAIILGRGTEGCGVTKFTLEQNRWLIEHGYDTTIFSVADKAWTRKNAHDNSAIELVKFKDNAAVDTVIHACNTCDYVIINSLPSKGHPVECIANFKRLIEAISVPVMLVQLDHMSASIRRNECMDEVIDKAGVIFSLSPDNDFGQYVKEYKEVGELSSFFGEDEIEIFDYQVGLYFDTIRDQYWKDDISIQDAKHHKWIGRTTSWKGYDKLFQFHDCYLKGNGCLTTFEGIERSPAYLGFRQLGEFDGHIGKDDDIATDDLSNAYGKPVQVFGPYVHAEMLDRMSRCGFGYQLTVFKPRFQRRALEYTHMEIVCAGVVPVFRELYGKQCHHRVSGDPLIECKDNGTVWLAEDIVEMSKAFELIKKLEADDGMRDEWRHMAYEFYKEHQDAENVFAEMFATAEAKIAS